MILCKNLRQDEVTKQSREISEVNMDAIYTKDGRFR